MKSTLIYFQVLLIFIVAACVLNGCAVLQEAQERRDARRKAQQRPNQLMLQRSDAVIEIESNALKGESDHYTITFEQDLLAQQAFDTVEERKVFAGSALAYMESLYKTMHDIFGFKPQHKIHIKLHHIYRGTTQSATTSTKNRFKHIDGQYLKTVESIEMDFPIAMYEKPGTRVHELTHAFTNIYFIPTWFSEGIAVLMEKEYAMDNTFTKLDLEDSLQLNLNGINKLEDWGDHADVVGKHISEWRYSYAYSIVSELRKQFGDDYYIRVFQLLEKDQLHQKLEGNMPTSLVVYYLSQAAGEDLVPFFEKLKFKVRPLQKADILQYIESQNIRP